MELCCLMIIALIISFALIFVCPPLGIFLCFICWRIIGNAWKHGEAREAAAKAAAEAKAGK